MERFDQYYEVIWHDAIANHLVDELSTSGNESPR